MFVRIWSSRAQVSKTSSRVLRGSRYALHARPAGRVITTDRSFASRVSQVSTKRQKCTLVLDTVASQNQQNCLRTSQTKSTKLWRSFLLTGAPPPPSDRPKSCKRRSSPGAYIGWICHQASRRTRTVFSKSVKCDGCWRWTNGCGWEKLAMCAHHTLTAVSTTPHTTPSMTSCHRPKAHRQTLSPLNKEIRCPRPSKVEALFQGFRRYSSLPHCLCI